MLGLSNRSNTGYWRVGGGGGVRGWVRRVLRLNSKQLPVLQLHWTDQTRSRVFLAQTSTVLGIEAKSELKQTGVGTKTVASF